MKIINVYSDLYEKFKTSNIDVALNTSKHSQILKKMALSWGIDLENVQRWMKSDEYSNQNKLANHFQEKASDIVQLVEKKFGWELPGQLLLCPSLMRFDGFARYDKGSHNVWFGIDHPDADFDYLKVLLAHELSHVHRDHQPDVWGFLGKPLSHVTRDEYLEASTATEHLVSEGLATLFSQIMFPEVPLHIHHYYFTEEMKWCLENEALIESAIIECLKGDENVWKFYEDDSVTDGSPSRTQYFWAAKKINDWLISTSNTAQENAIIGAHSWSSDRFECFKVVKKS